MLQSQRVYYKTFMKKYGNIYLFIFAKLRLRLIFLYFTSTT